MSLIAGNGVVVYQKKFPANLESLYEMLAFIRKYGEKFDFTTVALDQLTLGAEEALVNVMSYGYPGERKAVIEIICEKTSPQPGIKVTIKDQGIPFNPLENLPKALPSASEILSKAETTTGGYGIYIMVGLLDAVDYERIENENILTLIKYIKKSTV